MKKRKAALAALIAAGMLTGCLGRSGGGALNTESSRIYVTGTGGLQTATVETYEQQDYYNADELKAYLEETALSYNQANGEGAVKLESCSMEKGVARMIFQYSSSKDLVNFVSQYEDKDNQVDSFSVTTFSEISGKAESEGVEFLKASDGKKAEKKALTSKSGSHAVVIEGKSPVTIQTEGKLLFVSKNVVIKDQHTVQTSEGKNYIIFK